MFKATEPASVSLNVAGAGMAIRDGTLYLYSSPFGSWSYPDALSIAVNGPYMYIATNCSLGIPPYLSGPGTYTLNLVVPPAFQGTCYVNFTYMRWLQTVWVKVKEIDWYPDVSQRIVLKLNGTGWQLLQIGESGGLYAWSIPIGRLPFPGCVVELAGALATVQVIDYVPLREGLVLGGEPALLPQPGGPVERYTFLVNMSGPTTLYIYPAPCIPPTYTAAEPLDASSVAAQNDIGIVGVPEGYGYVLSTPEWKEGWSERGAIAAISTANGTTAVSRYYLYTVNTPVGMYLIYYYAEFTQSPLLSTDLVLFGSQPPAGKSGNAWLFRYNGTTYYYFGPLQPYARGSPLPFGLPTGYVGPFVIVADATGRWGGPPSVLSVSVETLRPWS